MASLTNVRTTLKRALSILNVSLAEFRSLKLKMKCIPLCLISWMHESVGVKVTKNLQYLTLCKVALPLRASSWMKWTFQHLAHIWVDS